MERVGEDDEGYVEVSLYAEDAMSELGGGGGLDNERDPQELDQRVGHTVYGGEE